MTGQPDGGLAAALLTLTQHGERLGALDEREGEHYRQLAEAVADLHVKAAAARGMLRAHGRILASLEGLGQAIEQLAGQLPKTARPGPGYDPIPAVQWWRLGKDERAEPIARIRSWVDHVFRPMYGHLAAQLGECWPAHPLALMTLDWLSELWSVLYLDTDRDTRTLTSQAEYSVRILPAAAAQLGTETGGCTRHVETASRRQP